MKDVLKPINIDLTWFSKVHVLKKHYWLFPEQSFNRLYIILLLYYNIIYYIIVVVLCNIYNDLIFLEKNDTNMNNF